MKTAARWIALVLFFFASVSLATAATVPAAPIGVVASAGNAQVKVSWGAVSGATSYNVYYSKTNSFTKATALKKVANAASGSWIPGLTNGTTYYFMVAAANAAGESAGSAKVSAKPSLPHALSGTVSGTNTASATIKVTGNGMTKSVATAANGTYSVPGLYDATYKVTPSLAGYTFTPVSASVTMNGAAVTGKNFAAKPAIASYSISGTVSYSGAKKGPIYLRIYQCSGCSPMAGTYIAALSSGAAAFKIRGLQSGTYTVEAEMDTLGTGQNNANNPTGVSAAVTISTANATGVNIVLTNPTLPAPVKPSGLKVGRASGAAMISWSPATNANGNEIATGYKIYWGTDAAATSGAPITVKAYGDSTPYVHTGLTNGAKLYYKVSTLVGAKESAPSAVVGPVTIGATTGANTVSGTVTYTGTATGPMVAGLYNNATGNMYFTTIASPASPQSYSVAGVPNGSYYPFAVVDMNNNRVIDDGDITNTNGGGGNITVAGSKTANITLPSVNATAKVNTDHQFDGTSHNYTVIPQVSQGRKRPVAVTLISGANLPLPLDMGKGWNFELWQWIGATKPAVGAKYGFKVTYSDGTSDTVSGSVTAVINSLPQNLVAKKTAPGSPTVPQFTWMAPASPPAAYTYNLNLWGSNDGTHWWIGDMPSSTLSVLYNADGSASSPALTPGNPYWWQVQVRDANGNSASYGSNYTP